MSGSIYSCGKCGEHVSEEASKCNKCGNRFSINNPKESLIKEEQCCEAVGCNKKGELPVGFEGKGVKWFCEKHYLPLAKTEMIRRYEIKFCKDNSILGW